MRGSYDQWQTGIRNDGIALRRDWTIYWTSVKLATG